MNCDSLCERSNQTVGDCGFPVPQSFQRISLVEQFPSEQVSSKGSPNLYHVLSNGCVLIALVLLWGVGMRMPMPCESVVIGCFLFFAQTSCDVRRRGLPRVCGLRLPDGNTHVQHEKMLLLPETPACSSELFLHIQEDENNIKMTIA